MSRSRNSTVLLTEGHPHNIKDFEMTFHEHVETFAGKPVVNFGEDNPVTDPAGTAYRVSIDDYDDDESMQEKFARLLADPASDQLAAIVIGVWGPWDELYEYSSGHIVEALATAAPQLPNLKALFLGDITMDENEVSWIIQTDLSPLWAAFPKLEILQVRGSNNLSFGAIDHAYLRSLVIECGGLPRNVLKEVTTANLPGLEHLELYLGEPGYGFDGSITDVEPLLTGDKFPKLKYLGLRDSEIADQVAMAVAQSPLLERLDVLDLSLGTLGDQGGQALLDCPAMTQLKKLDLHHHYLSDGLMKKLEALPIEVDVSDQESEGDYGRYVAVGE